MKLTSANNDRSILVYKSYGGIGDIFFTIPSIYMLKQVFSNITFATQPRLVNLFSSNLEGIQVVNENKVDQSSYDEVIELGNYPWFHNDLEKIPQITYHTHKKVKQHSIEHYKDGIISKFPEIKKLNNKYPYFKKQKSKKLHYTVHPGAGFLLKAWSITNYAKLIELISELYPKLTAKIIIGPNDPNPEEYFKQENIKYELITGDIDEVAEAVSNAKFHIGNDAGMTHLAGAFNIPILTIYGPTGPGSWGAFSENVELIWGKKGNCNIRCKYDVILNCENRVCLSSVKPEKMFYLLMKLLNRILVGETQKYMLNPDFSIDQEESSFVFSSSENEYLVEIKDKESLRFVKKYLNNTSIITENMPAQFKETFEALLQLNIFAPVLSILN